ncbi:MAG TPA: tyrosine-type recombinase/integrase [Thermoanaerobaculia bacterium]|nr:tyrosine-type recombinase/integrase [Thermoanaerobaculia bacterium]
MSAEMAKNGRGEPKWGRVWRYEGTHGVVWRIRYRDASGRRVLETLGKEPAWSRKRAEQELRRRLVDIEREGYVHPEKITLAAFCERWLSEYLPGRGLKLTTVDGYRQMIRKHLVLALGKHTLQELERRPEFVDRYVTLKMRQGYSPKTVTNHLLCLQVILKRAVRWRLISRNPVSDCERPRVEQPELHVLSEVEIARLLSAYRQLETDSEDDSKLWWHIARTITVVALGTAMRRGELLALRWRDVHLLEGRVQVREALVKGRFTTPKSRSGRRLIELGPRTRALLQEHWQRTHFRGDDELVFCHPELGSPLDPSKLTRIYMRPALKHAGITKPFRPFHDLRHTALTHEAAAGNPMSYIQLKAGHSQSQITERYIHAAQVLFPGAAAKGEARMFQQQP